MENVVPKLAGLQPGYFSVTYGAGGTTRDGTEQTVRRLLQAGHQAHPHLSLGGTDAATMQAILDGYRDMGVTHIVALRGDQPSGMGGDRFAHNAEALMRVIREHSGSHFKLIVAAYPEVHPDAVDAESDLDFFARKVDAGADKAITQYFYNPEAYADFLNRCTQRNINIPIIPGIMPITNYASLRRFSDNCGADIPRWLDKRLQTLAEDEAGLRHFGEEVVTQLCERLINMGAPSLHFYTLNRWGATQRICQNLSL